MQGLPDIPHGAWREVWPFYLLATLLGSSGWVKVWWDSRKLRSESRQIDAATAQSQAAAVGEIVKSISKALIDANSQVTQQRTEHAKEIAFLQEQLDHRQAREETARDNTHRAIAEIQRCIMRIRELEDSLKEQDIPFEAFVMKSHAEIVQNSN